MCLLTEEQIAIIAYDVENEGINYSHLSADLVDHVCCDIELQMNQGIPFIKAYELVKKEFGIKGLRRIQQDTLMLIDKNYRIMKSSMKLTGVLALALMAFGAMFKIMHWPFAPLMLLIGFALVALVFFPALLYVMYREVNQKKQTVLYFVGFISGVLLITSIQFKITHWPLANILFLISITLITLVLIPMIIFMQVKKSEINKSVYLLGLVSLMIILAGLLCKVLHWPGAMVLLSLGTTVLVLAFVPLYYLTEVRKSDKPRLDFLFGIVGLTYFVIFNFLLSLNGSNAYFEDYRLQDNSYRKSANYLSVENQDLRKDTGTVAALRITEQADLVYNKIEDVKVMITQYYFKIPKEDARQYSKNNVGVYNKGIDVSYLLSEYNISSPLPELKEELINFKEMYKELMLDSIRTRTKIDELINTSNQLLSRDDGMISWEHYHFATRPTAAVINLLSVWQYNIRLAEYKVLSILVNTSKS